MKKLSTFLLALCASALPVVAEAPRTVIVNPGEDATTSVRINWHSDLDGADTYCFFTTADDSEWANVQRIEPVREQCDVYDGMYSKTATGIDFYEEARFIRNVAAIGGLTPGTKYMYRLGETATGVIRYFSTIPDDGTWTAAIISDFHSYTPLPARKKAAMNMLSKLREVNGEDFDMILHLGDVAAWGGSYSFWRALYDEPFFRNYMWAGVNGNHDNMDRTNTYNGNQFFKYVNANPLNGYSGEEGVCYYTRLGDLLLIALNSEAMRSAEGLIAAQNWVKDVIANNPSKYTAIMEHYQWFYGEQGKTSQYSRWNDLFDKYEVDFALGANNHIYVSTDPVYEGTVVEPGYGTVYIQTPSSDNERGVAMSDLTYNTDLIKYRWTEGGSTVGALLMKVSPENITISLYDRNGNLKDENIIETHVPGDYPPVVDEVSNDKLDAVSPRTPLDITFSRRMDRASVEEALSIDNDGVVSLRWLNDYKLRVDLSQLLPEQTYTLTIDGSIARNAQTQQFLDGDGDGTEGGNFVLTFTMIQPDDQAPFVINTTPVADGEVVFTNRPVIGIEFNEEIMWDEVANADFVTVTDRDGNAYPGTLKHDIVGEHSVLQFYFNDDLPRDRAFLVTVNEGITDLSGNVADAFYFRFLSEYRALLSYTTVLDLNTLSDFWNPDQSGSSKGVISSLSGVSTSSLASSTDPANTGSIKMTYAFDPEAASWVIREYYSKSSTKVFEDVNCVVSAWVYGDGSNNSLCMLLRANTKGGGLKYRDPMMPIDWRGWRLVTFDLVNDNIANYTGTDTFTTAWLFDSFYIKHANIDPEQTEVPYQEWSGVLYFDEIAYSHWDDENFSRQATVEDITIPSIGINDAIAPAQGAIALRGNSISVTAGAPVTDVYVYTIAGTVVAHGNAPTLDVAHLLPGAYIVVARTPAGTLTSKVLKQ